jgi:hypothetical protein
LAVVNVQGKKDTTNLWTKKETYPTFNPIITKNGLVVEHQTLQKF